MAENGQNGINGKKGSKWLNRSKWQKMVKMAKNGPNGQLDQNGHSNCNRTMQKVTQRVLFQKWENLSFGEFQATIIAKIPISNISERPKLHF